MSTSYSASVIYGYLLPEDALVKRTAHPLWGKATFDPDTGARVPQFTEKEIALKVPDGYDAKRGQVARYDAGEHVIVGVQLADTEDLSYGGGDPIRFDPIVGTDLDRIVKHVVGVLAKAGIAVDEAAFGHYLVGSVY